MYAKNGVWRGSVTLWEDADAARNLEAESNLRQRQRR